MLGGSGVLAVPVAVLLLFAAPAQAHETRAAPQPAGHARACDGVNLLSQPFIATGISTVELGNVILTVTGPLDGTVLCQPIDLLGRPGRGAHCDKAEVQATHLRPRVAAKAVRCKINKERTKRGLSALDSQGDLKTAAVKHSALMVNTGCFAHQCAGEPDLITRVTSAHYLPCDCSWTVAENIGWGRRDDSSPAAIVDAWMHSPPHRELILTAAITEFGVGMKHGRPGRRKAPAGTYTADFGTKKLVPDLPRD